VLTYSWVTLLARAPSIQLFGEIVAGALVEEESDMSSSAAAITTTQQALQSGNRVMINLFNHVPALLLFIAYPGWGEEPASDLGVTCFFSVLNLLRHYRRTFSECDKAALHI
jgi:hypothetical protein